MLELRRVNAGYGRARIIFDVDLRLDAGETALLTGRNGAGKSTTLKSIMGLVTLASGEVRFDGKRMDGQDPYRIARAGIGYVPEDRRIFAGLTVEENLEAGRQAPRTSAPHWSPPKLYQLFPALERMRDRRGGTLSGGEQQMLAIARTLMGNPRVLLMDEPFEGLAPLVVDHIAATLRSLKAEGLAVLLCEPGLRPAQVVPDRIWRLEKGRLAPA
jgi:branched-chain amino acid transport system ATP-binding protein